MSSSSRNRQTFAKMTRERMVKERRAKKQEKKDEKRQAAAAAGGTPEASADDGTLPVQIDAAEVRRLSRLR